MSKKAYSYIRFSTLEQSKGDSLRRQLQLSKEYAENHKLELDDSLTLKDIGISAYSGANMKSTSALGGFLQAIREGKVEKDSVLIVESLDRISRDKIMDALATFSEIVQHVKLVTLIDGQEYTKDSINKDPYQLIGTLCILQRANEESEIKSRRLSAAWGEKKNNAHLSKVSKICPHWMTLDGDKFILIPERSKLIKRMFEMSLNDVGYETIAKSFNAEGIPTWGRSNGWHKSYISKTLKNRAVIGEYQPHKKISGKRYPDGNPVEDYYPKAISEDLFYQVQDRLNTFEKFGGRTGKVSNLFGGLAKCGYCGSPMQFVNKGKSPKGGKYLVCDSARRGVGCEYISVTYPHFENSFLAFCSSLKIDEIVTNEKHIKSKTSNLESQLSSANGQFNDLNKNIENTTNALIGEDRENIQKHLKDKLDQLFRKQYELEKRKITLEKELKKISTTKIDTQKQLHNLESLKRKLLEDEEKGSTNVRSKLRNQLRKLISQIEIFPAGRIVTRETINKYNFMEEPTEGELSFLLSGEKKRKNMLYKVHYKNGNMTIVRPDDSTPLGFIKSYEKDGDWITLAKFGNKQLKIKTTPTREDKESAEYFDALYDEVDDTASQ